jgi:hypothetical protein
MCPQFTVLLARTLPEWYGEHSLNRFSVPMLPNTPIVHSGKYQRTFMLDIIANNPIDQKVVELSSSQPYSLVEHSMERSVFPPQGV